MIIYKILNIETDKVYIGCTTTTIEKRFKDHWRMRYRANTVFAKMMRKYNKESLVIEEIERCVSYDSLVEREIFWIKFYNSTSRDKGYNMVDGGNIPPIKKGVEHHMYGKGMTDKQKEIMRAANVGRKQTKEHIEKCRLTRIGKKATFEHIEKCRIAKKGFRHSEESKNKISLSKIGTLSQKRKEILCLNNNKIYSSHSEAAKKLSLTRSQITMVVNGRIKSTKGFEFKAVANN